jgi:hypothetical protein
MGSYFAEGLSVALLPIVALRWGLIFLKSLAPAFNPASGYELRP